jgi:hypothetical protein
MRRISRQLNTNEEKVSKKITEIIQDLHLDLEMVGFYISQTMPYLHYNRLLEIVESAKYQKEGASLSRKGDYYQDNI